MTLNKNEDKNTQLSCPLEYDDCNVIEKFQHKKNECSELQSLLRIDELTRLFNYRYFLEILPKEIERTKRTGLATSLIMTDIDYFKKVNDTYGHEAGNIALKWFCAIIQKNIRKHDIACRYGGEEFVIILPGTFLPDAIRKAESLRKVLSKSAITLNEESVTLTASFGVDAYKQYSKLSVDDFIKETDDLLLKAKASGRNCTCYDKKKLLPSKTEVSENEKQELFSMF